MDPSLTLTLTLTLTPHESEVGIAATLCRFGNNSWRLQRLVSGWSTWQSKLAYADSTMSDGIVVQQQQQQQQQHQVLLQHPVLPDVLVWFGSIFGSV